MIAETKSKEAKKKHIQKKITEHLKRLPKRERERIERKEIEDRRKELEIITAELWKYREKETKNKKQKLIPKGENRLLREKLEEIKDTLDRLKKEEEDERERKRKIDERFEQLRNQKKWEEMKRMKEKEEKKNRMMRKEGKEKRLEMTKWIHRYIKENTESWEKEKIDRINKKNEEIACWERKTRLEKIKTLKEKFRKKKEIEKEEGDEETEMVEIIDKVETNWVKWRKRDDREEDIGEMKEREKDDDLIETNRIDLTINEPRLIFTSPGMFSEEIDDEELLSIARLEDSGGRKREKDEEEASRGGGEDEAQEEAHHGLGEAGSFCLTCVMRPCVCILVELEGKLKLLEGKNLKTGDMGEGVTIQTNQPCLNVDTFPKSPSERVHQIEPCSSNEHFENEAKTEESEYWIRDILHEILKRIPEIPGIKPINTCIPKPRKLEAGRSPRLRIKSTQLGNNRAGSTTITPPPKLKSLSKVKAAIAKINSEPSEPIVFGTKRSITPTDLPSAYKPELAKSSTSELPQSSLQGTKSIATLSAGPTANKTELTQSSLHCIPPPQTPTLSNIGIRGLQIPSLQTFPTINMVLKPPPSPILIPPARNKNLLAQHTHPPTHPTTQVSKMDPGLKQH